jgi:membrane protein implicated in regulation of membrane protease activity
MARKSDKDRTNLFITLFTLIFIGGGIIALVYGLEALLTALPVLLFGALIILLLWLLFTAVSRRRDRSEREFHAAAARYLSSKTSQEEE